jgi:hypothetical protein
MCGIVWYVMIIMVYLYTSHPPNVNHWFLIFKSKPLACCVLAGDKPMNYQHGTDSFMSYGLLLQTR